MEQAAGAHARPGRRNFLKAGGVGAAAVGVGALMGAQPASASTPPFGVNLKDDFGALGNGSADDTIAVQNAFNALSTTSGGVKGAFLYVPPGEYVITGTINISRFAGVVQGPGIGNTPVYGTGNLPGRGAAFRWAGTTAGIPMFKIRDSRHMAWRDLRFVGSDSAPPSAGLNFNWQTADTIGTNEELVVEDCAFGVWPWNSGGTYTGRLANGILFDGANGNNDQFRINRCTFRGKSGSTTTGISIVNTQSIWGSVNDCSFTDLTVGLTTASGTTMYNPQFNRCGTDLSIKSTARVDVFAWQSEHTGRFAALEPYAALRSVGGTCQIDPATMPAVSGQLISAYPSASEQTISLEGMRFLWLGGEDLATKPTIAFGPASPYAAAGQGFLVKVEDCIGLHASQCELKGTMYAAVPRSRGLVEWYSRTTAGIVQFRNELWNTPPAGARATLNTGVWDQPLAGTRN